MTEQTFNRTKNPFTKEVFPYRHVDRDPAGEVWTRHHTGACLGLLGGLMVLGCALFLSVFDLFAGEKSHSIWLFLAVYPLFAVGAHCLDRIGDSRRPAESVSQANEGQDF